MKLSWNMSVIRNLWPCVEDFKKIIGLLNFLKHSMLNVICNVNVKEEEETEVPLIPQM